MNKKTSTVVAVVVVLVTLAIVAVLSKTRPQPHKKPMNTNLPLVEVVLPAMESVQFSVESHGVVQPRTETTLVSEVSGVVQQVSDKFVAGGFFKAGEVLLKLDSTDYQVAVEQAKARLASMEAQYAQEKARAEQAQKEWDLSGRSRSKAPSLALREPFLLEAKANVESAKADLKKAEQKLARTVIRAPYDGMVKSRNSDVGQFVSMGAQLGVIFAIDYAEVRLSLTDKDLAFIELPKWGEAIDPANYPDVTLTAEYAGKQRQWNAKLIRMEGVVDQSSRVHYVVARITDPYSVFSPKHAAPLKMGTFVTAHIDGVVEDDVIKLPRDVFRDLDKVLVANSDNELYMRNLEIVRSEAEYVYVRQGLETGDKVVLTSIESPVQGMKVRIEGEPDPNLELEAGEAYAENNDDPKPKN